MKLTEDAIIAISHRPAVLALMETLGFTEVWITRLIEKNKPNGPLTTVSAVETIQQFTGLKKDEILEYTEVNTSLKSRKTLA